MKTINDKLDAVFACLVALGSGTTIPTLSGTHLMDDLRPSTLSVSAGPEAEFDLLSLPLDSGAVYITGGVAGNYRLSDNLELYAGTGSSNTGPLSLMLSKAASLDIEL